MQRLRGLGLMLLMLMLIRMMLMLLGLRMQWSRAHGRAIVDRRLRSDGSVVGSLGHMHRGRLGILLGERARGGGGGGSGSLEGLESMMGNGSGGNLETIVLERGGELVAVVLQWRLCVGHGGRLLLIVMRRRRLLLLLLPLLLLLRRAVMRMLAM